MEEGFGRNGVSSCGTTASDEILKRFIAFSSDVAGAGFLRPPRPRALGEDIWINLMGNDLVLLAR